MSLHGTTRAWMAIAALSTFGVEGCSHGHPSPASMPATLEPTTPSKPEPRGQILWFDRVPSAGYSWSFFLYYPSGISPASAVTSPLLVMPNNSGQVDDQSGFHRKEALTQIFSWREYAERLHTVVLVPAFPRPAAHPELYTHALDRDTLRVESGELRRIDLQLMAMIAAAHRFMGVSATRKVMLFGFSAAGMFANRFALLHPELVLAAAVGSPGGWPMAPEASWQSQPLRYPLGSSDLASLVGMPLNLEEARRVPFFFFLGAKDENDSLPYRDGYDPEDEALAMRLLGPTPVERWPVAESLYRGAGINAVFRLYPDTAHDVTEKMDADVIEFFARAMVATSAH